MKFFDVVIVGAGPAGLKCAEILGGSKLKVLIVEKNSEIGTKICAEGLTKNSVKYLNSSKDLIKLQKDNVYIHINKSKFHVQHHEPFLFTTSRIKLGQWQLKRLKKFENISLRKNTRVSKIEKNFIFLNEEKIKFKFLVGADGSTSIVRRHLGMKSEKILMALQYVIPTKEYTEFEVFFNSKLFKNGYAWIFRHKTYASIGCGCSTKVISAKRLNENFKKFIENKKIGIFRTLAFYIAISFSKIPFLKRRMIDSIT
jgi:flavin-dependent dehydrogenase